jgi:predicted TPR repeat methyltransferase
MTDPFDRARSLFTEGVAHFQSGRHGAAAEAFAASLALVPGRVSTLVNLGAAQVRLGQPEDARRTLDAALAQEADHADAWCHRGTAGVMLGQDAMALADFDRAIALGADTAALHLERALLQNRLGRHADALASLKPLLRQRTEDGQLHLLQGQTLQHLGRHDEAFLAYERALKFEPALGAAWSLRGHLLRRLGRLAEAGASFERAIAAGDDEAGNRYALSAIGVGPVPGASPPSYVRSLFDHYAESFDEHLVEVLRYRGHVAVVDGVISLARGPYRSALDLGCGSGLAAPLLRRLAQRIAGVDLSPRMIDLATRRALYDALAQSDLRAHLQSTPARHDLIVSCDVFIYIGELTPVFAGVQRVLQTGGVFGFSVEVCEAPGGCGFELQPSLRYAHSEPYLRQLAADHGLQVLRVERGPLREDRGQPIEGLFMYLGKP